MTKRKRLMSGALAIMMLVMTILSTTLPAFSATSSNGKEKRVITVQTKANWLLPGGESITLSQTKGTCTKSSYNFLKRKTVSKTSSRYAEWDIVAKASDGSHTVRATLKGSSVKIKLKANKTYQITVTWDSSSNTITELSHGAFTKLPTWRVKSTYKVSRYY